MTCSYVERQHCDNRTARQYDSTEQCNVSAVIMRRYDFGMIITLLRGKVETQGKQIRHTTVTQWQTESNYFHTLQAGRRKYSYKFR
jgi:hypothetical protein